MEAALVTSAMDLQQDKAFEVRGSGHQFCNLVLKNLQDMGMEVDARCVATLAPQEAVKDRAAAKNAQPVTPEMPSGAEAQCGSGAEAASQDSPEEVVAGFMPMFVKAIQTHPSFMKMIQQSLSTLPKETLAAALKAREPEQQASPPLQRSPAPRPSPASHSGAAQRPGSASQRAPAQQASPAPQSAPAQQRTPAPASQAAQAQEYQQASSRSFVESLLREDTPPPASSSVPASGHGSAAKPPSAQQPSANAEAPEAPRQLQPPPRQQPQQQPRAVAPPPPAGQRPGGIPFLPGQPRRQPAVAMRPRAAPGAAPSGPSIAGTAARLQAAPAPASALAARGNPNLPPAQLAALAFAPQRMHRQLGPAGPPQPHPQPPRQPQQHVYIRTSQPPGSAPTRAAFGPPMRISAPLTILPRDVPPPPPRPVVPPMSHHAFQEQEREYEEREFRKRIIEERAARQMTAAVAAAPPVERRSLPLEEDGVPVPVTTVADVANTPAAAPAAGQSERDEPSPAAFGEAAAASDVKPCKCKKSRCLKLYCDCFATGLFCNDACMCKDCENRTDTLNAVFKARKFIMVKDPTAFKPKVIDASGGHVKGCACRKSRCLKKYCECFLVGVRCTDYCRCVACLNGMEGGPSDLAGMLMGGGQTAPSSAPGQQESQAQNAPQPTSSQQHQGQGGGPSGVAQMPPLPGAQPSSAYHSREFTLPSRPANSQLPVTIDPMGGWGIPNQTRAHCDEDFSDCLPSRTSLPMKRSVLPIWNFVGQQLSSGRPTMAGALLQQNMQELLRSEAKGWQPSQTRTDVRQLDEQEEPDEAPDDVAASETDIEDEPIDEDELLQDMEIGGRGAAPDQALADVADADVAAQEPAEADVFMPMEEEDLHEKILSDDPQPSPRAKLPPARIKSPFMHPSELALPDDVMADMARARGDRDRRADPEPAAPGSAHRRGRRAAKRERERGGDSDYSGGGRSAEERSEPIRTRRAAQQEEEHTGLQWGVRRKVVISRLPEAWRDPPIEPRGSESTQGTARPADLSPSKPNHQRALTEIGRNAHKRAAAPAAKAGETTPHFGGVLPEQARRPIPNLAQHQDSAKLEETESDAAEVLLSFQ